MFDIPNRQFTHIDPQHMLYLAVSGSHAYGTSRPDSDIDVKGVYINPIEEYVSLTSHMKTKMVVDIGGANVDLEVKPVKRWLGDLLKGNGNSLENLFQDHIMNSHYDVNLVTDLQKLVMDKGIHKNYKNFYHGFSISQKKDWHQTKKIKCLLYVFRVIGAGIYLFENEEVEYNIHKIYEHVDTSYLTTLLETYDSKMSVMGTLFTAGLDKEYDRLRKRLDDAVENSDYPDFPKKQEDRLEFYQPFNDWMEDLYGLNDY